MRRSAAARPMAAVAQPVAERGASRGRRSEVRRRHREADARCADGVTATPVLARVRSACEHTHMLLHRDMFRARR
jgi:hypothetical protein